MHNMRTFSIFGAAAIVLTTSKLPKDCFASASPSKSSSPPSAFRSAVSDAFPWARFYDTIQDRREEGGGGEDDALLSQSLGPGNPSWTTAEALVKEAEAVPVFIPSAALARMDRSRLRLSSQLYAWREEEEESGGISISITEHYAVKRSPAERPVARWRPVGEEEEEGLVFPQGVGLLHMYERRRDLEGAHLEAMTGTYMPLAGYDNDSAHGEITNGKGVTCCTVADFLVLLLLRLLLLVNMLLFDAASVYVVACCCCCCCCCYWLLLLVLLLLWR